MLLKTFRLFIGVFRENTLVTQRKKILKYGLDHGKKVLLTLFNLKGIHLLEIPLK